nr:MAG TPA: Sodium/potassium-transporting ATPase subunit alpha-1 [Bacteriophage sp.]
MVWVIIYFYSIFYTCVAAYYRCSVIFQVFSYTIFIKIS